MATRLVERIKRLGYRPTPHTTLFERAQAFHRKAGDADFVVLLDEPQPIPGRRGPLPGRKPVSSGPPRSDVTILWWIRLGQRWSLPTYAEALRAMPCLELTRGLRNPVPPMVFKTLMPFPVMSVSVYGGETEIHTQDPTSAAFIQENLIIGVRTITEDIPPACLAAGYKRGPDPEGRWLGAGPAGNLPRGRPSRRMLPELGPGLAGTPTR